jgi:hypothetical protein
MERGGGEGVDSVPTIQQRMVTYKYFAFFIVDKRTGEQTSALRVSTTVTTPPASAAASSVTGSGQTHQPSVRYTSRLLRILETHLLCVSGLTEARICQARFFICCNGGSSMIICYCFSYFSPV